MACEWIMRQSKIFYVSLSMGTNWQQVRVSEKNEAKTEADCSSPFRTLCGCKVLANTKLNLACKDFLPLGKIIASFYCQKAKPASA